MSTPRSVTLPPVVRRTSIETTRGAFAGLVAHPAHSVRGFVLLIPGFTGSKEDFAPLLPLLAAHGWLSATYDQRGQYETPGADANAYTLASLAADAGSVAAALAPAGVVRHVLGHSFGGLVAQTAVLAEPAAWSSLVLLCSGPGGFRVTDKTEPLRALVRLIDSAPLDVVHEAMRMNDRRRGKPVPSPQVAAFLRTRYLANSPEGLKAIARLLIGAPDRVDELARLTLARAVVRGADDDAWAHTVQDETAARLATTVIVIPDAAHSPAVENPVETAQAICGFLDAV